MRQIWVDQGSLVAIRNLPRTERAPSGTVVREPVDNVCYSGCMTISVYHLLHSCCVSGRVLGAGTRLMMTDSFKLSKKNSSMVNLYVPLT